jgi:predicted small lipoprotein YifL
MMAACGQKGPLVLPDQQRPHKKIVLPKPPTAAESQAPAATQSPTIKPTVSPATPSPQSAQPPPPSQP